ncbi:hypothetical protein HMPREF0973_00617 [Prevotella veroralis F0319]|uniref:Uncharacterized protein n=1 Tax=Prevotella veroralis F0319 TaxID=649761 RepID=C9MLZ1_9BACT|nr:hypothetical protein HMPREF0973_00617 [Prevotella veroralis F0319]
MECCLTGCHVSANGRTDEGVCSYLWRLFLWDKSLVYSPS